MTMPNFLIIGAAKAGTTALYRYLEQHPQVYVSPVKETNFFALEGEELNFQGPRDQQILKHSSLVSTITDIEGYRDLFAGVRGERAVGEASPLYLYSEKAPQRIHHYVPEAKLIAVLRNPVERAYSNYLMMVRDGHREPLTDFSQALKEEDLRIRHNWEHAWHYRRMGFYCEQLKRYFETFERQQLAIYLYEDWTTSPGDVLRSVFRFLDVDDTFEQDMSSRYNVSGVPKSKTLHMAFRSPTMRSLLKPFVPKKIRRRLVASLQDYNLAKPVLAPEVRLELIEVYREDILRLQDLIQRDLSGWLK